MQVHFSIYMTRAYLTHVVRKSLALIMNVYHANPGKDWMNSGPVDPGTRVILRSQKVFKKFGQGFFFCQSPFCWKWSFWSFQFRKQLPVKAAVLVEVWNVMQPSIGQILLTGPTVLMYTAINFCQVNIFGGILGVQHLLKHSFHHYFLFRKVFLF